MKRFTVLLKYSLSHSKIQCDGEPLTNDELVRILNTNDGAFLENFNLKKENKKLKAENEQLKKEIGNLEHTKDFCAECCERLEKENEQLRFVKLGFNELNQTLNIFSYFSYLTTLLSLVYKSFVEEVFNGVIWGGFPRICNQYI